MPDEGRKHRFGDALYPGGMARKSHLFMKEAGVHPLRKRRHASGFALVVVLAVLLMVSVLTVGLLVMTENETKSAARYMDAADARLAADSVVQIVQGQIRQATTEGIDANGIGSYAWASQPGALWVYDDAGGLVNIYKLYSGSQMVVSTPDTLFDKTDLPDDWAGRPDEFVDLNSPVRRDIGSGDPEGEWIYPIASPEALPDGSEPVQGFDSTKGPGECGMG